MRTLAILLLVLLRCCYGANDGHRSHRVYTQQFPPGSEHLSLPEGGIICFSIFMGKVLQYSYLSLTLESMRLNGPAVQFVLVNVVEREEDAAEMRELLRRKEVSNFHLEVVTFLRFSEIVAERLHITVPFNSTWYYKMTDFKPTLAHLFPHLIDEAAPKGRRQGKPFAYWGYVDTDLVWGNFTRFAHIFHKGHAVVTSDYQGASGVAMFFACNEWGRTLFQKGDPLYTQLLSHHQDYQLDEFSRKGLFANTTIDQIMSREIDKSAGKLTVHRGLHWKDKLWLEAEGAHGWAGPARWFRGSLQIVRASAEFPAFHEILIFHRPTREFDLRARFGRRMASEIEADMLAYGFLLPNWVPLLTRHLCASAASDWQPQSVAMDLFRPFNKDCVPQRHPVVRHFAGNGSTPAELAARAAQHQAMQQGGRD